MNLTETLKYDAERVEEYLCNLTEQSTAVPALKKAEAYSLMAGGKRIRPVLALEVCRMFGGDECAVLPLAAAVEMVHTYSLIHDDLPCMDNDDYRRGKPTNHKVYGEATAVLAGDALLTDAFSVIATADGLSAETKMQAVRLLSESAGSAGMAGGQMLDLQGEKDAPDMEGLLRLQNLKTGCLIRAAAGLGCLAAGIDPTDKRMADILLYADRIGLVFQIVDDILDVTGTKESLGKSVGKDVAEHKTTFLSFLSVERATEYARNLTEEAIGAICGYADSEVLVSLARYLLDRTK